LFSSNPSQKFSLTKKKLTFKIDNAGSTEIQGKYLTYVSFNWPSVVAEQTDKQTNTA
jgi:hypothetical protein